MKLLKNVFFVFLLVIGIKVTAQTKVSTEPQARLKAAAIHDRAVKVQKQKSKMVVNGEVANSIDENDPYMGRKTEFLNNLTVNSIPNDFPIYQTSYGLAKYNALVDAFYQSHGNIVKDAVKQKLNIK